MSRKLIILSLVWTIAFTSFAQINIWDGVRHHKKVEMTPYLADNNNTHIAVVVCPGGSYFWHDMNAEGHEVGKWLQSNGISAFVLRYRTAYVPAFVAWHRMLFRGNRYPDPQDDLRQALAVVRQNAKEWNIDPDKIGAMGFSAGGHLVMSALELFDETDKPAFAVPVYPVVTMKKPYVHKRSRRGLLGDSKRHNKELINLLSLEDHVPDNCRPVFLVNCIDDPIVDYHNSVLLDSALTAKHINHVYLKFKTGGHGFGASQHKGSTESQTWKQQFINWINQLYSLHTTHLNNNP